MWRAFHYPNLKSISQSSRSRDEAQTLNWTSFLLCFVFRSLMPVLSFVVFRPKMGWLQWSFASIVISQLEFFFLHFHDNCSDGNVETDWMWWKWSTWIQSCLRSHGLVDRAVAFEVKGPGFNSSSDQMFFFSLRVQGGRNKMDPEPTNCVILRIHVD